MIRTCDATISTRIEHEASLPVCCPVSKNPRPGSVVRVGYAPTAGIVLPVENLAAMVAEYVDGLGSIRAMEEMIQDIAKRCAATVQVAVSVKADLIIAPPFGGNVQKMLVSVEATP